MRVNCPICRKEIDDKSYKKTCTSHFNNQLYKLHHCPQCGLEFWNPLQIIPELYENEGSTSFRGFHLDFNHRLFFSHMPVKSGRLLDVGCGNGRFLVNAQKSGFKAYGIDLDRKAVKVAREKLGAANVFVMSLEEFVRFALERDMKFDVITFFEVLEHQDKPKEFIQDVKKLLSRGGYIAGSVPNRERTWAVLDKKRVGDFPPHHFLWFSKDVLRYFFEKEDFRNIEYCFVKYSVTQLNAILGDLLFGSIKSSLKMRLVRSAEETERQITKSIHSMLFRTLKNIRDKNPLFLPVSLVLYLLSKGNGAGIYFQGTLKQD